MTRKVRVSTYKAEYDDLAIEILSTGDILATVAKELKIAESTLYKWMNEHESFAEAVEIGKSAGKSAWFNKMHSNIDNPKFSAKLYAHTVFNQYGMRSEMSTVVIDTRKDDAELERAKALAAKLMRDKTEDADNSDNSIHTSAQD